MKLGYLILMPLLLTLQTGCCASGDRFLQAAHSASCSDRLLIRIYFGMNMPGGEVSEDQWHEFLESEVTPRFPDGLTVLEGRGQWLGADKKITHEQSRIIEIVGAPSERLEQDLNSITEKYKQQFQQEAVMVLTSSVVACF